MNESPEQISVPDVEAAAAFYSSVFGAERLAAPGLLKIGARSFRLAGGGRSEAAHEAEVGDVDVCIARFATRGGRIVECAHREPSGRREGAVEDPFGQLWRLRSA